MADLTGASWRKSSRSAGVEGNCVEAAPLGGLTWSKSSRSAGAEGNCVEVAALTGHVAVRDSKRPDQAPLIVPAPDWVTFLGSLRQDH